MKHLPDLPTLQHRHLLFCSSVRLSVHLSTFMSRFDIYVKVSILINYKTKQQSNLAWNISLTSQLCDIGACFSICLSVHPAICLSVNNQYLLNYKAYNHQTLHSASPQCMDSAGALTGWPWPIFCVPLTFTPFTSPFHMSSTVRPSTTKPYIVLLLNVLTRQVPWPGDLDLYFALQWPWHILRWCSVSPQI